MIESDKIIKELNESNQSAVMEMLYQQVKALKTTLAESQYPELKKTIDSHGEKISKICIRQEKIHNLIQEWGKYFTEFKDEFRTDFKGRIEDTEKDILTLKTQRNVIVSIIGILMAGGVIGSLIEFFRWRMK